MTQIIQIFSETSLIAGGHCFDKGWFKKLVFALLFIHDGLAFCVYVQTGCVSIFYGL